MTYEKITVSSQGERVNVRPKGDSQVPDYRTIPFIEDDGMGVDVTSVMRKVVDAAPSWLALGVGDGDLARLKKGADERSCSGFGEAIIANR